MTEKHLQVSSKYVGSLQSSKQSAFDYSFKLIIIGDSGVGKSSLLIRFNQNKFFENHMATIGINHACKTVIVDGLKLKLHIWDTAGQQKFKNLTKSYYRNSQGAIVAFSINSYESYFSVRTWIEQLNQTINQNTPYILVGTKIDLADDRVITKQEAQQYASNHGIQYCECSAKSGQGIEQAFLSLAKLMKTNSIDKKLVQEPKPSKNSDKIKITNVTKNFRIKCCQN